jgi:hypothetical protein
LEVTLKLGSDDYQCWRCNRDFKWEQLITTRAGNPLCSKCTDELNNEALRKCPVDGADMEKKRVLDKFLIDKCSECGGVWFDKGELRVVQEAARQVGYEEAAMSTMFVAMI